MKKSSKFMIGAVAVIAIGAISYRLVNRMPDSTLPPNEEMLAVMNDAGCIRCHSANPDLPFYSNWPIARTLITEDILKGYQSFDMGPMLEAIKANKPVNEVDLAKVEKVILDGTMPLAKYYLVHWGSSMTSAKNDFTLDWIKQHRAKFYPNTAVAAEFANDPVRPVPDSIATDPRKVALGEKLYFDKRLSADGTVACATCHALTTGGVDNKSHSEGIRKQLGGVNAPTVFNACFNFVQFWDGRAKTLADQAGGPPLNPVEMGCKSFDEIVARLKTDAAFSRAFAAAYPQGLSKETITDAIQQYEMTLVTPNSAFDKYLKGDKKAMTAQQINGYKLFKKYSCATCHAGINMGGLSYDYMGLRANYFADRKAAKNDGLTDGDNGRWAQTKKERDRYRFKTPGLRNVALTYPYYHDGSVQTLEEAVTMMGKYQVGVELNKDEVRDLTEFMRALTGTYKGKLLTNKNKMVINKVK